MNSHMDLSLAEHKAYTLIENTSMLGKKPGLRSHLWQNYTRSHRGIACRPPKCWMQLHPRVTVKYFSAACFGFPRGSRTAAVRTAKISVPVAVTVFPGNGDRLAPTKITAVRSAEQLNVSVRCRSAESFVKGCERQPDSPCKIQINRVISG
jgi:hypothetical protein